MCYALEEEYPGDVDLKTAKSRASATRKLTSSIIGSLVISENAIAPSPLPLMPCMNA
jgi:hypothetical protein